MVKKYSVLIFLAEIPHLPHSQYAIQNLALAKQDLHLRKEPREEAGHLHQLLKLSGISLGHFLDRAVLQNNFMGKTSLGLRLTRLAEICPLLLALARRR